VCAVDLKLFGLTIHLIIVTFYEAHVRSRGYVIFYFLYTELAVPKCDSRILSDWGKGGTVTSPNYPQTYPPLSHCRIDFIGSGRQRVALSFVDFHLSHSQKQEEDTK
jgi:hypothetical protein